MLASLVRSISSQFPGDRVQRRTRAPDLLTVRILVVRCCWTPQTARLRVQRETEMDGGDGSPVMTDIERRAYRYGHRASPRLPGLAGYGGGGRASCVCAPTTHPGSFRCKHHRHATNLGAAAAAVQGADEADEKHNERERQKETAPAADQADKSS